MGASGQLAVASSRFLHNTLTGVCSADTSALCSGGAFAIDGGNVTVAASAFDSNSAENGGAVALRCEGSSVCSAIISTSWFLNNTATDSGGAVYASADDNEQRLRVESSVLDGNAGHYTTGYGGGIMLQGCYANVSRTVFGSAALSDAQVAAVACGTGSAAPVTHANVRTAETGVNGQALGDKIVTTMDVNVSSHAVDATCASALPQVQRPRRSDTCAEAEATVADVADGDTVATVSCLVDGIVGKLTDAHGLIVSASQPDVVGGDLLQRCEWVIEAPVNALIQLLPCSFDVGIYQVGHSIRCVPSSGWHPSRLTLACRVVATGVLLRGKR